MRERGSVLPRKAKEGFYENINLPLSTGRVTDMVKTFFKANKNE